MTVERARAIEAQLGGVRFEDDVEPAATRRRRVQAITAPPRRLLAWWDALVPSERVMYRGLVLLSAGLGLVWIPLALIVPGVVLTATALGFSFRGTPADG